VQEPERPPAGAAWQTALGAYAPVVGGRPLPAAGASALVLQLPAEGPLAAGGVAGVLRRPPGAGAEWLGCGAGGDFYFSTAGCAPADAPAARPGRAPGRLLCGRARSAGGRLPRCRDACARSLLQEWRLLQADEPLSE
jgi:hypothetical protein